MKRLAVVDIGTHSALLLVADVVAGQVKPVLDEARTTHLGVGLERSGVISPEALARLVTVLAIYEAIVSEYAVDQLICFATAAFRNARNAAACQQQIQQRVGWPVRILSGEEEALYTFKGSLQTGGGLETSGPTAGAIAIDIGGGSTEVIWGHQGVIKQMWSFPVGAVGLCDRFSPGEQIDPATAAVIDQWLMGCFAPLPRLAESDILFVTGGTATTLAALLLDLQRYDFSQIDGRQFSRDQLEVLYSELNQLSQSQRADLPGMEAGRAGVILPALRILWALLQILQAQVFTVTVRGARYGILADR